MRRKKLDRCREWLMAAARNTHMFMQGLSGNAQIEIKVKSDVTSPIVKRESITPKLEYPISPPVSPDPNDYRWGSREIWYRKE